MAYRGPVQKKVLALLLAGLAISLTPLPRKHFKIIKGLANEWGDIDRRALISAINSLYRSKLINQKRNKDGTVTFLLSNEGRTRALTYDIDNMEIKKDKWDGKWRIITFDIPEKINKVRNSLRYHLKNLGFKELHRSVFIIPFRCNDEIEYIVEFYNVRRFVRSIEALSIDNELDLKRKFNLL